MTVTPFAPKRPDNVTELFTNIAMVKKNGLVLSSKLNQQCKCQQGEASSLISSLLKADPAEYDFTFESIVVRYLLSNHGDICL